MGLDAVVYANKTNLPIDQSGDYFLVDEQTGEVYPDPRGGVAYSQQAFTAIHRRLGNASLIATLANEISAVISPESILLKGILYSASHSGDLIRVENLGQLKAEIDSVRQRTHGTGSRELDDFLMALNELIEVANRESNPIVFT